MASNMTQPDLLKGKVKAWSQQVEVSERLHIENEDNSEQMRIGWGVAHEFTYVTFYNEYTRTAVFGVWDTYLRLSRDGGADLRLYGAHDMRLNDVRVLTEQTGIMAPNSSLPTYQVGSYVLAAVAAGTGTMTGSALGQHVSTAHSLPGTRWVCMGEVNGGTLWQRFE